MNNAVYFLFVMLSSCTINHNDKADKTSGTVLLKPNLINNLVIHSNSVTFPVDSVEIASTPLTTYPCHEMIEWKLEKEITLFPSGHLNDSLIPVYSNGFMETIHMCYDQHRPLVLSPDIIWLTICQGVSIHVNQHFEELKSVLFNENKPDQLIARNDSLENGANEWANLIGDLSGLTKEYTRKNMYSFFVPQFSTTTSEQTTAYQITLLEVYKDAFEYIGESGCGIPTITVRGTAKDWEMMREKLEVLDELNLTYWKNELIPIINEFTAASKGEINLSFWKDIYKFAFEYNGFYTSGWSLKLFPYLNSSQGKPVWEEATGMQRVLKGYRPNPFLAGTNYRKSTLSLSDYPGGISAVDLMWKNYNTGEDQNMTLYAGFFGAKQFKDLGLEPFISWAIVEKGAPEIERKVGREFFKDVPHNLAYWSPKFAKNLSQPAIYNPVRFQSQDKSMAHLKEIILEALAKDPSISPISKEGMSLDIEIYSNGEMGTIVITGSNEQEQKLREPILDVLKNLPSTWSPATAKVSEVLRLMERREDVDKIIPVNSKVIIRF